ncbi:hypothetical protein Lalb_Chr21g0313371 [Lupinus albus]|uniref:Uncharacterized protein n=1 Tax=Lupinus albus TaxID=3870 RepID=A0A6A4NTI8_LUPAL|nr:hypothetical protein Lalb_Chr21g0313371 [Lupinus albus]
MRKAYSHRFSTLTLLANIYHILIHFVKTLSYQKFPSYLLAPCFPFSPFFISSIMAFKIHQLLLILLWLTLILLLFHEYYNLKSNINKKQIIEATHSLHSHQSLVSRKVLASKFDFSPFLKHHHDDDKHQPSVAVQHNPSGLEIDPRYGVEKRRVPTGPNPLHH